MEITFNIIYDYNDINIKNKVENFRKYDEEKFYNSDKKEIIKIIKDEIIKEIWDNISKENIELSYFDEIRIKNTIKSCYENEIIIQKRKIKNRIENLQNIIEKLENRLEKLEKNELENNR